MGRKLLSAGFWVAFLLLIAGCAKEYSSEGMGTLPNAPGGTSNRRCISCTYLPFCDSSEFTYLINDQDTVPGTVRLLADTTLGGVRYNQLSGFAAFNQGLLYNCDNQEYRLALSFAQFGVSPDTIRALVQPLLDSLLPVPGATLNLPNTFFATVLKANQAVGSKWLDTLATLNVPFSQGPFSINLRLYVGIEYTYLQKDITRTVLGTSYNNVQYVQGKPKTGLATALAIPLPVPIPSIDGQADFYLSKNVGLIELKASDSTGTLASAKLVRYRL